MVARGEFLFYWRQQLIKGAYWISSNSSFSNIAVTIFSKAAFEF